MKKNAGTITRSSAYGESRGQRHVARSQVNVERLLVCIFAASCVAVAATRSSAAGPDVDFQRSVKPLLAKRCASCHDRSQRKGGLDLTDRREVLAGGDSGPVIEPGRPDESLLWQRVSSGEMPPEKPLTEDERNALRAWLTAGAPWSGGPLDAFEYTTEQRAGYDWWSLQPVHRPELPALPSEDASATAVDCFIRARLFRAGLTLSPSADRRTLIRRLTYDLTGLPPAFEDVAAFVSDPDPMAYERLVDRLLASPQYGERWARHWLDVVRFGESQGFERDKLRLHSWRYRDWVIDALNDDLPYRDFARLQLAGDYLSADKDDLIATGFLVAGPYDEVGQSQQSAAMRAVVREDELEEIIGTVGQTFLGLTVNCGRCHDHKFDPVRQAEYYRFSATLAGLRHGERDLPGGAGAVSSATVGDLRARLQELEQRVATREGPARQRILAEHDDRVERTRDQFEIDHLKQQMARATETRVYAATSQPPPPTHILARGNPAQPLDVVLPGGIASLRGIDAEFGLGTDSPDGLRRARLADWIASEQNPLFSRVIVNRLWHYHFGVGLVETPNDFGFNGGRPSHPELIDWLASELVRGGWSLKRIQRQIVLSATYRQSSMYRPEAARVDADCRLLWRFVPRRLEAEALRDTMLSLADELDPTMHGPGYYDFTTFTSNSQFYEMRDPVGGSFQRRSVYRTWVRSGRSPFLDLFDCPDPSTKAPQRAVTTTPLQALSLLNNSFVLRMAERFAHRVTREGAMGPVVGGQVPTGQRASGQAGSGKSPFAAREQVRRVFARAFGRPPDDVELASCETLVREHGLAALCRVVFNSNELLYVD